MLNPSAAEALPENYPAHDYGRLFDHTVKAGVGVVGIRVLAGGALSGSAERHPIASPPPEPIGSAMDYDADIERARRLMPLVKDGFAGSLTEAATRFAISHDAMGTILVGIATPEQFDGALARGGERTAAEGGAGAAGGVAEGICGGGAIASQLRRPGLPQPRSPSGSTDAARFGWSGRP